MNASSPTLLVVDDEANVREVIGKFAARVGFQVDEAASGRQAAMTVAPGESGQLRATGRRVSPQRIAG